MSRYMNVFDFFIKKLSQESQVILEIDTALEACESDMIPHVAEVWKASRERMGLYRVKMRGVDGAKTLVFHGERGVGPRLDGAEERDGEDEGGDECEAKHGGRSAEVEVAGGRNRGGGAVGLGKRGDGGAEIVAEEGDVGGFGALEAEESLDAVERSTGLNQNATGAAEADDGLGARAGGGEAVE